ncbi:MAG: hypothetical protein ABEK36_03385 [Candidatus Aenigmatarchaeota archaeon]
MDKKTLATAAAVSLVIFLAGIFVGWNINKQKINVMKDRVENINRNLEGLQTEFLFLNFIGENASCPLLRNRMIEINEETYKLGNRLTSYDEGAKFKNQENLQELKRNYYHSLIRYWLLSRKMKESCGTEKFITVLYFFNEDCDKCSDQGFLLSYYKRQLDEKLLVFTLDADFEDPFIKALLDYNNIEEYPSLVVEGQTYKGFKNKDELEEIFCEKESGLEIC